MTDSKEILKLAVELGNTLLHCGGEIYRVEDTIKHILDAFQIEQYGVYVLSNGIFASIEENETGFCLIRQTQIGEIHLGKIAAINQLSREICTHKYNETEAWERLNVCKSLPTPKPLIQGISCGIGCACFCSIFGGDFPDSVCAFPLGFLLQCFRIRQEKQNASKFLTNMIGSAFLTAASFLIFYLSLPVHYDKIVIGGIVPLLPGIALTTSIRDLFNGDYLSGAIHLLDALLTAMCIAVGVGFIIVIYRHFSGGEFIL